MKKTLVSTYVLLTATILALALASPALAADGAETNKHKWEGSAAFGLTLTRGNSKTLLGNVTLQASDKWEANELLLSASGTYGESEGDKTTETADASAQYNRLFTERFY